MSRELEDENPESIDGTKTKLKARLDAVQPIIEQVCQSMGQVGVSYGVLSRQEVVLARGHGFRDLAAREASDEHTLYNIASCTKAFTATACVMLAREGSLDLEVPVRTYVPELEEAEATLIDLLALSEVVVSHDELIPRINALPRVTGLRSKWLYNNWMYALAGVIIERKSTEGSYLDFMNELIFKKFGLSRTCLRRDDVPDANISRAYAAAQTGEAMIIEEPPWEDSPFTPEGGIRSSVCDMVTWARHLLEAEAFETAHGSDRTTHEHTTPLHPGGIFAPKMILPDGVSVGRLERTYAMGFMRLMLPSRLWFGGGRNDTVAANVAIPPISPAPANAGHHTLALSHCGENAGQLSSFVLLPEQDAAVIVLGNTTALGDANELITHLLVSQIVGSTEEAVVDYPSLAQRIAAQCKDWHKTVISDPLAQHRISGTAVSGPLNDYVGRYKDPASGFTMTIAREHDRDRLVLHQGGRPSQRAPLHHYHFDTFTFATESYDEHMRLGMIDFDDWRILLIRFERGWDGSVSALRWFLDPDFPPASLLKVK